MDEIDTYYIQKQRYIQINQDTDKTETLTYTNNKKIENLLDSKESQVF
jgi:hypothetical protein